VLDEALFLENVNLEVASRRLTCARTQFRGGANLRVRWAEVALEETEFASASTLVKGPELPRSQFIHHFEESTLESTIYGRDTPERPRVVSVRRANVANLLFSDVDLRACRFVKSQKLDELRLEGDSEFASTPKGLKWSRRQILAEENQWREKQNEHWNKVWKRKECQPPAWLCTAYPEIKDPLNPRHIADIYRQLRKGREDSKDAPGAADFYYGEMEMRKHDKHTPRGERVVIFLYWLVSGYGLRASRAFAALLVTVLVFAGLFWHFEFGLSDPSFAGALLFSAESTTSLLRKANNENLTNMGEALWIALRLLGPVFLGLFLLSLRGRVKR